MYAFANRSTKKAIDFGKQYGRVLMLNYGVHTFDRIQFLSGCNVETIYCSYSQNNLLFCTELGNPIDPRNMMRKFYNVAAKASIFYSNFHSLRHTFATRVLEAGINIKVLQELLGHADIGITLNTYGHVLPDIKKS